MPIKLYRTPAIFEDDTRGEQTTLTIGTVDVRFYHRNNFLGQPHRLTAAPITLNDADHQFFIERGFGSHATSMVTGVISIAGEFLAEAEKKYGVFPIKQADGTYKLSAEDFKKLDPNTQIKYIAFQAFQQDLKTLSELERSIEPNDQIAAGTFRTELLKLVMDFRSKLFQTPGDSVTLKHSDDILFEAEKFIKAFAWPLDPDDETKTRRRPITEADQLFIDNQGPKKTDMSAGLLYLFDANLAIPGGMNSSQRDTFAHCIVSRATKLILQDRKKFIKEVQNKIPATKGIGAPYLNELETRHDDDMIVSVLKGAGRAVYAVVDILVGWANIIWDAAVNLSRIARDRFSTDEGNKNKVDLREEKKSEQSKKWEAYKKTVEAYEAAYQAAYLNALKDSTETDAKALIQNAKDTAETNKAVEEKKSLMDSARQQLQPIVMISEGETGPEFIRGSAFGSTYEIGSAIGGVIEDLGLRDPVIGTVALGTMGVGIAYVATVGAVGHGSTALAAKASKFVEVMNKTGIYPAFYHGVAPIHPAASSVDVGLLSFINGLTVGKAVYLGLSLTRSLATNQAGLATEILNVAARNPIETAFIAAMLYGMGAETVAVTHEQAALGSWLVFDKMVIATKPAAILYDLGMAMMEALHDKGLKQRGFNDDLLNTKLTEMFFRALTDGQTLDVNQSTILRTAIVEALNDPTLDKQNRAAFSTHLREKIIEKIPEDSKETFQFLKSASAIPFTQKTMQEGGGGAAAAVEPVSLSLPLATLGEKLYEKLNANDQSVDEIHYLRCFAEGQLFLQAKPDTQVDDAFIDTIIAATPKPIIVKTVEEKSVPGLFTRIANGVTAAASAVANSIIGNAVKSVYGLTVGLVTAGIRKIWLTLGNPDHEKLRTLEKWGGYDSFVAAADGLAALFRLPVRVGANAIKTPLTALSRVVGFFGFINASKAIDRGISKIETFVRDLGDTSKKYFVKRPDDVPHYRFSMGKVELVDNIQNVNVSAEISCATLLNLRNDLVHAGSLTGFTKNLKVWLDEAHQENSSSTLVILRVLFPIESQKISDLLDVKKISEEQRNKYQLASLQKLFCEEMQAAKFDTDRDVRSFVEVMTTHKNMINALSGIDNFVATLNYPSPEAKISAEFDELRGTQEKRSSSLSSQRSASITASADTPPAVVPTSNNLPAVANNSAASAAVAGGGAAAGSPRSTTPATAVDTDEDEDEPRVGADVTLVLVPSSPAPGSSGQGAAIVNTLAPRRTPTTSAVSAPTTQSPEDTIKTVIHEYLEAVDAVSKTRFFTPRQSDASREWIAYLKGERVAMPQEEPGTRLKAIMKKHEWLNEDGIVMKNKIPKPPVQITLSSPSSDRSTQP